jgi:molybdopterin molybdotransferase
MDGYAVRAADVAGATPRRPVRLRVVADLPAGSPQDPDLRPGTCARIMTGAALPGSADAVVPVEATDGGTDVVEVTAAVPAGRHVRRAAEDVTAGERVLPAGIVLGPHHVAAAAATGHAVLSAVPRPRVAVVSTGSELVPPGAVPRRGQIPDSNSFLLAACVRAAGCEAVRVGSVPDDAGRLGAVLEELLDAGRAGPVDAVITSGGVSVGAYDVVKELFADGARVAFVTVAMQPGKPQGFGVIRRPDGATVPLFALPGNPVSAYVSFEVFVRPALQVMRGLARRLADRPVVPAVAREGWRTPPGRRQYIPVRLGAGAGGWEVRPAGPRGSGSHLAVTLAAADGLGVVDAAVEEVRPGDTVRVMLTAPGPQQGPTALVPADGRGAG